MGPAHQYRLRGVVRGRQPEVVGVHRRVDGGFGPSYPLPSTFGESGVEGWDGPTGKQGTGGHQDPKRVGSQRFVSGRWDGLEAQV